MMRREHFFIGAVVGAAWVVMRALCTVPCAHADGVDSAEIHRMRVALESIAESARKCAR